MSRRSSGVPAPSVQTTPTPEIASASDAQLSQLMEQWEAEQREIREKVAELKAQMDPLETRLSSLRSLMEKGKGEQLRRTAPFREGDIVLDDQGVRYRVHKVAFIKEWVNNQPVEAGSVWGIRLTKNGVEAYARPRVIVSSKPLVKEEA